MQTELSPQTSGPAIVDLSDPENQTKLAPIAVKAITRIADYWHLNAAQVAALLGGVSERTWFRMQQRPSSRLNQDQLTRISAIIGIFKGLRLLFSEPLAREWVTRPNSHAIFGGKTPIQAMIDGGIPKMLQTRGYIDALRGGL